MKPISERTSQEIEQLRNATSAKNLPKLIRHHLGKDVCDAKTAENIAVAINRKWVIEIRPFLTDRSILGVDDAKIRHEGNVLGALKELGAAIRQSGNGKKIESRVIGLYELRSADSNYKKDLPRGHRQATALPTGGFQFAL